MSLTSFIKDSADVRARFKAEFVMPPLGAPKELLAPPLSQNYSLVGSAFDQLLRFYIERLNKKSKAGRWIAAEIDDCTVEIHVILAKVETAYIQYLQTGNIDDELLEAVLGLARLEPIIRRGEDASYLNTLPEIDSKDVQDLRRLIWLVRPEVFKASKVCALNPTFGRASELVGGADGDLVIDDALIEIKTTKHFEVKRDYFDQLIGYYALFKIGGIDQLLKSHSIKRLGIYFSRHGHLLQFNINDIIGKEQLSKFLIWFKKRAKQDF